MVNKLKEMTDKLNQKKGERNLLIKQKRQLENEKSEAEKTYETCLKARIIAQTIAENTQKQLEYHFSSLVTLALAVFPDPYDFQLRFVRRRNKMEADLIFSKNGNETDDLKNTAGGGVVDIASLALMFACQGLDKTSPIMLLDEPAKFLSVDLQEKASEFLKLLSNKLGIQIIMVSHLPNMIAAADNIIQLEEN